MDTEIGVAVEFDAEDEDEEDERDVVVDEDEGDEEEEGEPAQANACTYTPAGAARLCFLQSFASPHVCTRAHPQTRTSSTDWSEWVCACKGPITCGRGTKHMPVPVHRVPAAHWPARPAGKVDANVQSEMRTNMDVDAGEERRDEGLRVQVRAGSQGLEVVPPFPACAGSTASPQSRAWSGVPRSTWARADACVLY